MIIFGSNENLRLVNQAAESLRMYDTVSVALIVSPVLTFLLRILTAFLFSCLGCNRRKDLIFPFLYICSGDHSEKPDILTS